MREGLYHNRFSEQFTRLLEKSGVSSYAVNKFTGIDEAYLSRLKSGEKNNPSPEIIIRIALALVHYSEKITMSDIEHLFKSAGRSIRREKTDRLYY